MTDEDGMYRQTLNGWAFRVDYHDAFSAERFATYTEAVDARRKAIRVYVAERFNRESA